MENKEVAVNQAGVISMGFDTLLGMEALKKAAQLLCQSDIIPDTYKGKPANCLIALNMANRMHADPMMVMQNLYQVYGRPSWSSKFLIATFNSCGKYSAIRYQMCGKQGQDDWGCTAWAVELSTGEKLVGTKVDIAMAKAEGWVSKKGSKWQTMPEKMLRYRAASFFINEVAPEISCGMMTSEEVEDTIELKQNVDGSYEHAKQEADTHAGTVTVDLTSEPKKAEPVKPAAQPAPAKTTTEEYPY